MPTKNAVTAARPVRDGELTTAYLRREVVEGLFASKVPGGNFGLWFQSTRDDLDGRTPREVSREPDGVIRLQVVIERMSVAAPEIRDF